MAEKSYLHLIQWALAREFKVAVDDGGERYFDLNFEKAMEHVESVGESQILLLDEDNETAAWAAVVLDFDQAPEETICDYSDNPLMEQWWEQYDSDSLSTPKP